MRDFEEDGFDPDSNDTACLEKLYAGAKTLFSAV